MKNRIIVLLAAALCLCALFSCAAADTPPEPVIRSAGYLSQPSAPAVTLEYSDPEHRTWIDVYLLKKGTVSPSMGTVEYGGETWSIVGIQTVDPGNPDMYMILENGRTLLSTELYLGDCGSPSAGEKVYLTVGLTSDGAEVLGTPVPLTVPPAGETASYTPDGAY